VTVVTPVGRHQLTLPAADPVERFLIDTVAAVGLDPEARAEWTLVGPDDQPINPSKSLIDASVTQGAVLSLVAAELPPITEAPKVADPPTPFTSPVVSLDDEWTPLQRTAMALPHRLGVASRLTSAVGALFQPPPPELEAGPLTDSRVVGPVETLSPASLSVHTQPSRLSRSRARWRSLDYLGQLDDAIVSPRLRRCATIALVSPKGGVGKTTLTALLGTLLVMVRRDHVVAVDTNPDYGSLGRVLTPNQPWFVDDILGLVSQPDLSLTTLDAYLGRAIHGLLVVPAPTDPKRMERLDEDAYTKVIQRLKEFFSIVLLDCGTGLQEPAAQAAIATCDQVVLITDGEPATASLVAEAASLLEATGRPLTVAVNKMPKRGGRLDLDRLASYVPTARGLVVIPDQPEAASSLSAGRFDWRDAPSPWKRSLRELAVSLLSDWERIGLAV
jgi:MinD-like ATPase involved in chromosome partitioning or flagellar assembly